MSRCCRTSVTGTSISALTPRTPIVPFMLASQPGTAIVNCHGSLCVIVGGATSFGASSIEPASTRPMIAKTAPARKNNLILMSRFLLSPPCKSEKKICYLVDSHDLVALEAKASHQSLLIDCEGVDAAMYSVGCEPASHSFIHDADARFSANFQAAC